MPPRPKVNASRAPVRLVAVSFLPVLALATWAVVARLAGGEVPLLVLLPAGLALLLAVLLAAACAAHALVRRRWGWGVALLVLWPVTAPAYLWVRSAELQV